MNFAIDQFTEERFGLVTGSQCAPLFTERDAKKGMETLAKKLANEMYFKFYDEFANRDTEHGNMCEVFAMEFFAEKYDKNIKKGGWYKKDECGGNTDAELSEHGIDFKCPTKLSTWLDYIHEPISSAQQNQCQMYMYLTGKEKWYIAAFLLETQFMSDNGLVYPVPQNGRMILREVDKDIDWEDKLSINLPKVVQWRNEHLETLKKHFGNGN